MGQQLGQRFAIGAVPKLLLDNEALLVVDEASALLIELFQGLVHHPADAHDLRLATRTIRRDEGRRAQQLSLDLIKFRRSVRH
jgi:hypothetical protein